MAEISRFWPGTTIGDAGPYSSDNFADYVRNALYSAKADSGPFMGSGVSPDFGLTVQATGPASAAVAVLAGSAHVRGYYYELTATQNMSIAANSSGNPRIDTIILRANWTTQTVRLVVLQGTPAGSPVPAALTQVDGTQWEIPLAEVTVNNGFVTITNSNITPRMNWSNVSGNIELFDILNNSGGPLVTGDVVVWDFTQVRAVKTSTTVGDPNVAGVWVSRTAAGGYGRLLVRGVGLVNNPAGASAGQILVQSGTAKAAITQGAASGNSQVGTFAVVLQAGVYGGANLSVSYVDASPRMLARNALTSYQQDGHADYTTTNGTFNQVDANIGLTPTVTTGRLMVECTFTFTSPAGGSAFDIFDSVSGGFFGRTTGGLGGNTAAVTQGRMTIVGVKTGLAVGTQLSLSLYAKSITGGNTTTILGTPTITIRAWEI